MRNALYFLVLLLSPAVLCANEVDKIKGFRDIALGASPSIVKVKFYPEIQAGELDSKIFKFAGAELAEPTLLGSPIKEVTLWSTNDRIWSISVTLVPIRSQLAGGLGISGSEVMAFTKLRGEMQALYGDWKGKVTAERGFYHAAWIGSRVHLSIDGGRRIMSSSTVELSLELSFTDLTLRKELAQEIQQKKREELKSMKDGL